MNFPRKDQNPEICAQWADALAKAGKILPGPGKMPVSRRQRRAVMAASATLSIFDVGPALPALSKTLPSGYTDPQSDASDLSRSRATFEVNALVSTK
jgi:hypothetical protein